MGTRPVHWPSMLVGTAVSVVILGSAVAGALADRLFVIQPLDRLVPRQNLTTEPATLPTTVGGSDEYIADVVEQAKPAIVTISIQRQVTRRTPIQFGPFSLFTEPDPSAPSESVEQDIGTGFVVSEAEGLVVTNRHVVADLTATYTLIDSNDNKYEVTKIYRDPVNDLAILQTTARLPALKAATDPVRVGQTVIAIGTALGEFRQTVTTGVVSGLGRGIEASTGLYSVERIDNLIQTDAAINPGNSGGPLLNSRGEVIGVNVAVAAAENIGFAIPISVVEESLRNFAATGKFDRPFLGIRYKLINKDTALLNDVPEGAYVLEVIAGSTAEKSGLQPRDIVVRIDGKSVTEASGGLSAMINTKKIGDSVTIEYWRNGTMQTATAILLAQHSP